jgi:hypothetical protein
MAEGFLGEGDVYFNRYQNGAYLGFVALGNCESFEIKTDAETKERISRQRDTYGQVLSSVSIGKPSTLSIAFNDAAADNIALQTHGAKYTMSQAALATDTSETMTLIKNKWVELPSKTRNVGTVAVKVGTVAQTSGTDYVVLERMGMIKALTDTAATSVAVTYHKGAISGNLIAGSQDAMIRGEVRLDGRNKDTGELIIVSVWDARLKSESGIDFLAQDFAGSKLSGTMVTPSGKTAPYEIRMNLNLTAPA